MCSTLFLFFILGLVVLLLALQCELPCKRAVHGLQLTKLTRRDPRGADPCAGQNFRPRNLAEPYFCRVNDSPCLRVFLDSDCAESVPPAAYKNSVKKVYLKTLRSQPAWHSLAEANNASLTHSTLFFLTSQLHLAELWEEPFWVEGQPWKISAELGDFGKIV
ncbi:uncharacterized protein EV420DRAFT_1482544 [Desarmillaria tabescens]|uniref:Uncharacterized protein n=1 Tax=Armillaria tabescens TaxID=1929756 RepID=A0AA39JYK8_ARMTA|nr:uncharacterized protein EV420DRAFT_1482544 [Desarmillaria tabescens]KAK0451133.1 hypothetical protein EV420DRAFT_1482544 [Desarmillaria tabescens]